MEEGGASFLAWLPKAFSALETSVMEDGAQLPLHVTPGPGRGGIASPAWHPRACLTLWKPAKGWRASASQVCIYSSLAWHLRTCLAFQRPFVE